MATTYDGYTVWLLQK